jgi:hypothetical protein
MAKAYSMKPLRARASKAADRVLEKALPAIIVGTRGPVKPKELSGFDKCDLPIFEMLGLVPPPPPPPGIEPTWYPPCPEPGDRG